MRNAGSHNCNAVDHSGPLDPKDEGTATVRNVVTYPNTWIYVDLHLQTDTSFLSSGFISECTTLPLMVNNEVEGQTLQHMRGLALVPQLHLWRWHTPRGRLCHKNCVPQRDSKEYMFLILYLSLNIESFRSKVSRVVLSEACEGGSLCVIFDHSMCLLIEMCSDWKWQMKQEFHVDIVT